MQTRIKKTRARVWHIEVRNRSQVWECLGLVGARASSD